MWRANFTLYWDCDNRWDVFRWRVQNIVHAVVERAGQTVVCLLRNRDFTLRRNMHHDKAFGYSRVVSAPPEHSQGILARDEESATSLHSKYKFDRSAIMVYYITRRLNYCSDEQTVANNVFSCLTLPRKREKKDNKIQIQPPRHSVGWGPRWR